MKTHTNLATYALVSIETIQLKHAHKYAFVRLFKPSRDFAECTFLKRVCYSCRTVCVFITVRHAISVKHNPFLVHLCLQENENAVFRCYVFHFGAQFLFFFLILLNQLMRGKHLKLVAAEESIHTPHSSLNVQLLFYIIKSRPICFLKKKKKHNFTPCFRRV